MEDKSCKYCGKHFELSSNLKRHIKRLHEQSEHIIKSVSCSECDYKCRDNYQLKIHMRSHSKEKPFMCNLCEFRCSKKEDCKRHISKCTGPKYICDNCGQGFKSKRLINEHMSWDIDCGNLGDQNMKQSLVKIKINNEMSVLGVNCNDMIDNTVFERQCRKTRCGVCYNCSVQSDCGQCKICQHVNTKQTKILSQSERK